MGASFFAVATSLIGLVGDYLFNERMGADKRGAEALAVEITPLFLETNVTALQSRLVSAGAEMSGRLMVLDESGKVQFDSYSELNGKRLYLPEVAGVLTLARSADYGIHSLTGETAASASAFLSVFRARIQGETFAAYCAVPLSSGGGIVGALLFSSSVQQMMENLYALEDKMIGYFMMSAAAALVFAMVFSRLLTRPIAALTRGIQRMSRGDFSGRVPLRGSGELRKLSETFNSMSEKLEALDQSRNQFVSNASHELKTPLSTMKILLESILYQPDMENEVRTEFLSDINKEIDRLSQVVSDLLTLVSMDAQTARLNRESMLLANVVRENIHRLTPMAEKRGQQLLMTILDDGAMYADYSKLTQVVYNLVENAIKYTPDGGVIRVRLARSGRDAVFTVTDNGAGIPKKDQAHIFDRFYRVDKARSRDTGGTGLGLSIVHQFVLMHGGSVSVRSEEGAGSTFTVELPLHQE